MEPTIRQWSAFLAVARAGGFTAAATSSNLSQSALSRAVADLENGFGAQLIERDTRNVSLTPAGHEAVLVAEQIIGAHRTGQQQLRQFITGASGTVTLATLPSIAATLLPQIIQQFLEMRPAVGVRIRDGLDAAVISDVAAGRADFGLTAGSSRGQNLSFVPWLSDQLVAVLPENHQLAKRSKLKWAQLSHEPFVAVSAGSSVRRITDAAFTQVGTPPHIVAEASSVATVGGLVAAGLGVSAVPVLVVPLLGSEGIALRRLSGPSASRQLHLVSRGGGRTGPAARAFLDLLLTMRDGAGELPDGVKPLAVTTDTGN